MSVNSSFRQKNSQSAFKFKLQEEKYQEAQKQMDMKNMSVKLGGSQADFHKSLTSPMTNEQGETPFEIHNIDYNNNTIKLLVERYQKEIKDLKGYIHRVNSEIRKSSFNSVINIPDIPNTSNYMIPVTQPSHDTTKTPFHSHLNTDYGNNITKDIVIPELQELQNQNNKDYKNYYQTKSIYEDNIMSIKDDIIYRLNQTLDRFVNPDYLNPLFSVYDHHILFLEKENLNLKKEKEKDNQRLMEIVNENSFLRQENLFYKEENLKLLSNAVINNDKKVVYNEEFIQQLEERNNLLSRENELLTINYQKITKDFFDFKIEFNDKYQEFLNKITQFDALVSDHTILNQYYGELKNKNIITENKLNEGLEEISRLEIQRDNLLIDQQRLQQEIFSLKENNEFYKNHLNEDS